MIWRRAVFWSDIFRASPSLFDPNLSNFRQDNFLSSLWKEASNFGFKAILPRFEKVKILTGAWSLTHFLTENKEDIILIVALFLRYKELRNILIHWRKLKDCLLFFLTLLTASKIDDVARSFDPIVSGLHHCFLFTIVKLKKKNFSGITGLGYQFVSQCLL